MAEPHDRFFTTSRDVTDSVAANTEGVETKAKQVGAMAARE
jgi:hypothetical protein